MSTNKRNNQSNVAEIQNGKLHPKERRGSGAPPAPKPKPKGDRMVRVINGMAWTVSAVLLLDATLGGAAIYDGFDDPGEAVERAHFLWVWGVAHLTALGAVQGLAFFAKRE